MPVPSWAISWPGWRISTCGSVCGRCGRNGSRLIKKMGTMDRILVLEAVFLVAYTVADLVVFWHTGSEPATLTGCVFGVCGLENGVMGWIKTNKDKAAEAVGTSGSGTQPPPEEPPAGTGEPPDAGL